MLGMIYDCICLCSMSVSNHMKTHIHEVILICYNMDMRLCFCFVFVCKHLKSDVLQFQEEYSAAGSLLLPFAVVSVAQSCLTLCDPLDCSSPGSSAHGILQARILEQVATSSSRGFFLT